MMLRTMYWQRSYRILKNYQGQKNTSASSNERRRWWYECRFKGHRNVCDDIDVYGYYVLEGQMTKEELQEIKDDMFGMDMPENIQKLVTACESLMDENKTLLKALAEYRVDNRTLRDDNKMLRDESRKQAYRAERLENDNKNLKERILSLSKKGI